MLPVLIVTLVTPFMFIGDVLAILMLFSVKNWRSACVRYTVTTMLYNSAANEYLFQGNNLAQDRISIF